MFVIFLSTIINYLICFSGGLQPGDIVTHIDGKPVKHANDIYSILSNTKSRSLKMSVSRFGHKIDVTITPEDVNLSTKL